MRDRLHLLHCTKMMFSIKDFFSKCDQIRIVDSLKEPEPSENHTKNKLSSVTQVDKPKTSSYETKKVKQIHSEIPKF